MTHCQLIEDDSDYSAHKKMFVKTLKRKIFLQKKVPHDSPLRFEKECTAVRGILLYIIREKKLLFDNTFQSRSFDKFNGVTYYKCKDYMQGLRNHSKNTTLSERYIQLFNGTMKTYMKLYREFLISRYATPLKRFLPWDTVGVILSFI